MPRTCPRCDATPSLLIGRAEIAAELATRDAFFARRLARRRTRDITDVVLGMAADILRCDACGILVRDAAPDDDAFRDDPYDAPVLESLHAEHAAAFREKDYRLLPAGARVLEVGSYVGGFLAVAKDWEWDAVGVDIGGDTAHFARTRGFDVRESRFEECGFDDASFDAVFIWNCFEQLESPRDALAEARRVLRPSGFLVIRVPDADFYLEHRTSVPSLAYNALLGWPHRFGFCADSLSGLAADYGFTPHRVLRAPAIRPLHGALRPWAQEEEAALLADGVFGWIEVTFRAPSADELLRSHREIRTRRE